MKNYKSGIDRVKIAAPYDVSSGDGCQSGSLFGVAVGDAIEGENAVLQTTGKMALTMAAVNVTIHTPAYWDDTAKKVTNDSDTGSNKQIGIFAAAATSGDATVDVFVGLI